MSSSRWTRAASALSFYCAASGIVKTPNNRKTKLARMAFTSTRVYHSLLQNHVDDNVGGSLVCADGHFHRQKVAPGPHRLTHEEVDDRAFPARNAGEFDSRLKARGKVHELEDCGIGGIGPDIQRRDALRARRS